MLRVSTKGEYGVRIMVDLARHFGGRPRSLSDISQTEMLPLAYLEQLVKLLRETAHSSELDSFLFVWVTTVNQDCHYLNSILDLSY